MKIDRHFFSKVGYTLIRHITKDPHVFATVQNGPIKSYKWCLRAGGNYYPIGTYEAETIARVLETLRAGDVFYDLGANAGYFSLAAAKKVGNTGLAYAFEPMPKNLEYLEKHIAINGVKNVEIIPVAVADKEGAVRFTTGNNLSANTYKQDSTNYETDSGFIDVPTDTLDHLVYGPQKLRVPNYIKIDVEGAELDVLNGARRLLQEQRPQLLLSTHDRYVDGIKEECFNVLKSVGYVDFEDVGRDMWDGLDEFVVR